MSELRRNIQINGELFHLAVSQYGSLAPTSGTAGKPGVLYLDTSNGNLYKCTAADPESGVYSWAPMVGSGGMFAVGVTGEGAEEAAFSALKIERPNSGYRLSIGDKLITTDNYLYEVTAVPEALDGAYTAKLVRTLGGSGSLYGSSAPQQTTVGTPGQLYMNTTNGNLYKCTAADPANNSYTWVAMVGGGGVFATTVNGAGAEEISVMTLRISKPNTGYVLSIGDKLITRDNYLYEITALPVDAADEYTAKLVQQLGTAAGGERTAGILIEATVAAYGAETITIATAKLVMPDENDSPREGDYVITTDNCLYRITSAETGSDGSTVSCSLMRDLTADTQRTSGIILEADTESGGAESVTVTKESITAPLDYTPMVGDLMITSDNCLYRITEFAIGSDTSGNSTTKYTGNLVRVLGGSGSLYGSSAPQQTTVGTPGQLYMNTTNGNLYKCTAADPENNSYTWVAMVGGGGVFATTVNGEGAEEISVMALRISKPNAGYVLSIGDKLITADNYLYEITALPEGLTGGYSAKLIRSFGSGSSSNVNGLTATEKTLILSLFKNTAYTADMSATIAQLETLWSGGDVPDLPDTDVSQSGSILSIVSGVTASQNGNVLAIA